ncbi:ABC transporter ATP-binding protein [Nakamurella lactea]|uniref:ABC transporter ATP-binding protein n=1 Tax=Nakamurella lactea TaxID=459515 RepID=UPI000415DE6A|nr:ABC transporter ATP-binding protein [Nakamurella lactea]
MSAPILSINDLQVTYHASDRQVFALQGATLKAGASETIGVVGESGSGKSTIARAALGLLPSGVAEITGGSIAINGRDVTGLRRRDWQPLRGKPIAMVFQDPLSFLNPVMRVDRQIGEAIRRHAPQRSTKDRVVDLLELVQLPASVARSYPHELSGGMRQRVLMAVALACEPSLLIADEPTTALDVTTQAEIVKLLRDIQRTLGVSVLLISHNLAVVAELCDQMYVMYAGRVVESGPADEILSHPGHPYTYGLMTAARSLRDADGRYATIAGDVPSLAERFVGCPFAARCPVAMEHCTQLAPPPTSVAGQANHVAACWHLVEGKGRDDHRDIAGAGARHEGVQA